MLAPFYDAPGSWAQTFLEPGRPHITGPIIGSEGRPASGTIFWPGRHQAPSTNLVTVWPRDDGFEPLAATNTFSVIVTDYLEVELGQALVQVGQTAGVPVQALDFAFLASSEHLSQPTLTDLAPAIVTGLLKSLGADWWCVHLGFAAGSRLSETAEEALDWGVRCGQGRVFAELWDLPRLSRCNTCFAAHGQWPAHNQRHSSPRLVCRLPDLWRPCLRSKLVRAPIWRSPAAGLPVLQWIGWGCRRKASAQPASVLARSPSVAP